MRFSATRLRAWMECPLQAHYKYDVGLPRRQNAKASFGTIVHAALKTLNDTGDLSRSIAEFQDHWNNPEKLGVAPDYWPKFTTYAGLRSKGVAILRSYWQRHRFQDRTVLGTEIPFLVPFGDHELHGYIDLLDIMRSGTGSELLRIVDFKSSSREPNRAALALDVQFTVYALAVSKKEFWAGVPGNPEFPGLPNGEWLWETVASMTKRCIWFHLWNQKEFDAGPRTQADFQRLYRLCDEIAKATENQIFVPRIGEACHLCDAVEQCAMEIPVALAAVGNPDDANRWI